MYTWTFTSKLVRSKKTSNTSNDIFFNNLLMQEILSKKLNSKVLQQSYVLISETVSLY